MLGAAEIDEGALVAIIRRVEYGFTGEGGIDRHTALARAIIAALPAPASGGAVAELPDEMRIPLHELQADLDWLTTRISQEDEAARLVLTQSMRDRLSFVESAAYRMMLPAPASGGEKAT
jgi:hypothetical protein